MSKEAVEQFLAEVQKDKALQDQLQAAAQKDRDAVAPIMESARSMGYEFTREEFLETQDAVQEQLTDEQLEAIAGGQIPQGERIVKWTFTW